jgi:cytochrome c556
MTEDKFFKFTSDELNMLHYMALGFEPYDHELSKHQISVFEKLYTKLDELTDSPECMARAKADLVERQLEGENC